VALNIVTHGDMAIRGRSPSDLPPRVAGTVAMRLAIDLGKKDRRANREAGLGALLGYGSGLIYGAFYGAIEGRSTTFPLWARVIVLTSVATTGEWVATGLGLTNPRKWGLVGWVETLVPRAAYAMATIGTYNQLGERRTVGHSPGSSQEEPNAPER
jgi:hypothetical protein